MKGIIYLDNAATTPVSEVINQVVERFNKTDYFNMGASYIPAVEISRIVEENASNLLNRLGAKNSRVIFTAGATEANNLAVFGALKKNAELVISAGEHPSVYECAKALKERGVTVHFAPLMSNGTIDLDALKDVINAKTGVVSVMHVSNETGAINDIERVVEIVKDINPKAVIHSDGVQAVGKLKVDLFALGVDMYTISAHKIGAPKGVGALVAKQGIHLAPIIWGGGQGSGIRSGTENVSGIMALCKAVELAVEGAEANRTKCKQLKEEFLNGLRNSNIEFKLNSLDSICVPNIISLSFNGLKGEVLLHILEESGILISTGSACSSKRTDNRVLAAMGITTPEVKGSVRLSTSTHNTIEEMRFVSEMLAKAAKTLTQTIKGK